MKRRTQKSGCTRNRTNIVHLDEYRFPLGIEPASGYRGDLERAKKKLMDITAEEDHCIDTASHLVTS